MTETPHRSTQGATAQMNRSQMRVFDDLLSIGAERPFAPDGLADHLENILLEGTQDAVTSWTEPSLWLSKSQLQTVRTCEGQVLAYASTPRDNEMRTATVVGVVAHRAIQIGLTRTEASLREMVEWALEASRREDSGVSEFWEKVTPGVQAEAEALIAERVGGFLDAWPPLQSSWDPRFEMPIQAKVGKLTLAGRVDLALGRPRPPKQTMLLCDLKTGALGDRHEFEARFYALLSTLRYGVPPYRSVVYSIASGEWTQPADVTADMLETTAVEVADLVTRQVELLTNQREPELSAGRWCNWCPAKATCPAVAAWELSKLEDSVPIDPPVPVGVVGAPKNEGAYGPFSL